MFFLWFLQGLVDVEFCPVWPLAPAWVPNPVRFSDDWIPFTVFSLSIKNMDHLRAKQKHSRISHNKETGWQTLISPGPLPYHTDLVLYSWTLYSVSRFLTVFITEHGITVLMSGLVIYSFYDFFHSFYEFYSLLLFVSICHSVLSSILYVCLYLLQKKFFEGTKSVFVLVWFFFFVSFETKENCGKLYNVIFLMQLEQED